MRWRSEVNMWRSSDRREKEEEEEEQVEVLLRGKAPWGFTLRGGSEHREPLVITKVEEGGAAAAAAAAVCLQAGDELVSVNAVPLSGSRLEVISLVKSSQKTLTLVVRRAKMVDVVSPCTMPSDTEVHVARSFLTKILRSSMRKNDPGSRPHSWHSSKLTEEESELAKREDAASPVWQPKNVSESKDLFSHGDQDSQHQLTRKFCSVNNMERLERPLHPFTQGRLSPTRYTSTEALCRPGGRRESGLSCFSSGVSPPVHDSSTSGRKGSSAENVFFKGHRAEGQQQGEWPRLPQSTPGAAGWEGLGAEEQPAPRVSIAGRPSTSSLWKVPEKKKSRASPPPPAPLRSDSFAVTKVFPYSEGPSCSAKTKGRSDEKLSEHSDQNGLRSQQEKVPEAGRSFNPLPTKDFRHPGSAADHNHSQLRPDKLFSLSSVDVRQSRYSLPPAHQRQYSDESPQYLKSRSAPPTKIQSVGSYYRSLQDLPMNAFGHKPVRHSTASTSSSVVNTIPENGGHKRYYGLANNGRAEGRRGETEKLQWAHNNEAGVQSSLKPNVKAKYSLPQPHTPHGEDQEQDYRSHQKNGLHHDHQTSDLSVQNRGPEDSAKRVEGQSNDNKTRFLGNDQKISLSRLQDPWVPQEDRRISPLKTPFLHSLAQESKTLAERQSAGLTAGFLSSQDAGEIMSANSGKSNRRSDRYATTLRNEIQQKRAQLQKSRSAATLTCDAEDEEAEDWRSARTSTYSGVSSSNSYKDHLKEAQARVLQATSFQRRDLEPLGPEVVKTSNGRVRGRKRLPLVKRGHSFSEPDKIDKVGVEGEPPAGTFGERRKFFEAKPAFPRPVPKSNQGPKLNSDLGDTNKTKERTPSGDPEDAPPSTDPCHLNPGQEEVFLEQQRLGTFAEYQATWNQQKKSSEPTQGRYHSAENILDADAEDNAVCVHERSRSSPSADFCTQNIPSAWRDPHGQQSSCTSREPAENRNRYQSDHSPHSSLSVPRNQVLVPELTDHRPKPDSADPTHNTHSLVPLSLSPNSGSQNPSQLPRTKGLLPQTRTHLETTSSSSSSSSSQEFPSGAPADRPLSSSDPRNRPAGPAQAAADRSRTEEVKERAPSSSSPTSTWTPARSPSPPFAPPRLSDTPPPAVFVLRDESRFRSEHDLKISAEMDVSGPAKRVPVRIVHSESSSDPEGGASRSRGICCLTLPPPHTPSLRSTERPAPPLIKACPPNQNQEPVPEINPVGVLQTEEDAKREELARDIMGKDKSLVDILDQTGRKTTMDLMEGLFPTEDPILEGVLQRKRASSASRVPTSSPRSEERREDEDMAVSAASLVPSSSYYNTSAPKAELLIKMKDMQEHLLEEQDSEDELDVDLASKKQELISSLAAKLEVLREARHSLQEDMEDNEALGREVETTVQRLCRPNQLDKFRMFVGDLDKVVSLLLSLSGRLARVENALNSLEEEAPPEEKRTLTEKRKLLMRQHEDAKELKENLDRRERLVSGIMEAHLGAESLDDYRHFVKMKSGLIIEQRKLEDKIKLGEEQLKCLVDSLPLEQRLLL